MCGTTYFVVSQTPFRFTPSTRSHSSSVSSQEGASENITTRFAGHFRLKGFEKAVAVYELLGLRDQAEPTLAWRATFEQSLKEFSQTDFDAAERGFRCTLEMRPGDGPAEFYLRQIAELRLHAPAPGWTGEIELKEK